MHTSTVANVKSYLVAIIISTHDAYAEIQLLTGIDLTFLFFYSLFSESFSLFVDFLPLTSLLVIQVWGPEEQSARVSATDIANHHSLSWCNNQDIFLQTEDSLFPMVESYSASHLTVLTSRVAFFSALQQYKRSPARPRRSRDVAL